MPSKPLTAQDIQDLVRPKSAQKAKPPQKRFPAPPQDGPLRYYENEARCVNSGYYRYEDDNTKKIWVKSNTCGSPTHYRLLGKPLCATHSIRVMNEILIALNPGDTTIAKAMLRMIDVKDEAKI